MRRAGRTNRKRARALTREVVFSWRFALLALGCTLGAALLFGMWLLLSYLVSSRLPPGPAVWFVAGAAAACIPWTLAMVVMSIDGSFYWRLGADGEEYTAKELSRLGNDWRVRHNVPFATRNGGEVDVDHVAIGPHGVLVVETKLCTTALDLAATPVPYKVRNAARQAEVNGERVRRVIGGGSEVTVIPMVVYWGRAVSGPDGAVRRVGDVRVVRGQDAAEWRALLTHVRVSPTDRDEMIARLDRAVVDHEGVSRNT